MRLKKLSVAWILRSCGCSRLTYTLSEGLIDFRRSSSFNILSIFSERANRTVQSLKISPFSFSQYINIDWWDTKGKLWWSFLDFTEDFHKKSSQEHESPEKFELYLPISTQFLFSMSLSSLWVFEIHFYALIWVQLKIYFWSFSLVFVVAYGFQQIWWKPSEKGIKLKRRQLSCI